MGEERGRVERTIVGVALGAGHHQPPPGAGAGDVAQEPLAAQDLPDGGAEDKAASAQFGAVGVGCASGPPRRSTPDPAPGE
jgi:hypothetical protein